MKKILLVSSSKSFLDRSKNLLARDDFQVITAQSGAEALQLQKKYLFDLILSDLHLQDVGGDTLCSGIRSEDIAKNTAIILICYDNKDEHTRIAKCGADAKIIRPVQPEKILETVGSLLNMQLGRTKRAFFTVKVLIKKGEVEFCCVSIDISITGILLETDYHLDIGDRIICLFTLPGASQIETEGDVVRSIRVQESIYKYGVQFVGLPLSFRKEIENYVTSARNSRFGK